VSDFRPDEFEITGGGRLTVRDVLVDAERRLAAAGVPSPSVDAAELVAFALGTTRTRLFLHDSLDPDQRVRIENLLTQRAQRIPLQHLTGTAPFRRIELAVGPGVFIPRPETELVCEAGIRHLNDLPVGERIAVDLCSGSGAIALSLGKEVPQSRVYAVEWDDQAVQWTRRNAKELEPVLAEVGSKVFVIHDDAQHVADPEHELARLAGTCALVVCNPPYIPSGMVPREPEVRDHEPTVALYGGDDGMDLVRGIVRTAAVLLRPGGVLAIEHADVQGPDGHGGGVPAVVSAGIDGVEVFTSVVDRVDLNARPRFTLAVRTDALLPS